MLTSGENRRPDRATLPLAGQVGIVTGAGKGLGRALALHLARQGARLVVNNRNRQVDAAGRGPADHVVHEINSAGGKAVGEYSDVGSADAAESMIDRALAVYGQLDFVVANAAISGVAMFHKSNRAELGAVLQINVLGLADLARCASVYMRARGYGRIVLLGATAGLHGEATASAYAASKGAVMALGRTIALEGAPRGVLTNVVLPYATTPMTEAITVSAYREAMSSAAVAPIVGVLVDPKSALNGQCIVTGNDCLRAVSAIEWGTVAVPHASELNPSALDALLCASRRGVGHEYASAREAFTDYAQESVALGTNRLDAEDDHL